MQTPALLVEYGPDAREGLQRSVCRDNAVYILEDKPSIQSFAPLVNCSEDTCEDVAGFIDTAGDSCWKERGTV